MSLTFILNDGHLEFIGIGALLSNALKNIYILTSAAGFRVVACGDGDHGECLISFLFYVYLPFTATSTCEDDKNTSQQLLRLGQQEQVTPTRRTYTYIYIYCLIDYPMLSQTDPRTWG